MNLTNYLTASLHDPVHGSLRLTFCLTCPPKIGPSDELVYFYNSPAKGGPMAKKRYSAEQIIQLLREVEIHTSEGKTISQASRQIGETEQNSGTSCSMEKSLLA